MTSPSPTSRQLNPEYRARLFEAVNSAPFLRHLALKMTELGWGSARFEMEAAPFRLQPFGVVHGGNFAMLIDSATFWACFLTLDSEDDGLTSVDLKVNYLAPSRLGPLGCDGKLIKAGKTLSYAEAEVRDAEGRLLAHGTSTLMRLPQRGLAIGVPMWMPS